MAILTAGAHVLTVPIIVSPGITWGGYVYLSTDALGANPVSGATGTIVTSPNKSNGLAQNISLPVNVPSSGGPFYAWVVVLLNGSFWGVYSQNGLVSLPSILDLIGYIGGVNTPVISLASIEAILFSDVGLSQNSVYGNNLPTAVLSKPLVLNTLRGVSVNWINDALLSLARQYGATDCTIRMVLTYINQATGYPETFRSSNGISQYYFYSFINYYGSQLAIPSAGVALSSSVSMTNINSPPTLYVDEPLDAALTIEVIKGAYGSPGASDMFNATVIIKNLIYPVNPLPPPIQTDAQNNLSIYVTGSGTITINPSATRFTVNAAVSITATPQAGWYFAGWYLPSNLLTPFSMSTTYQAIMTDNVVLYAVFESLGE